MPSRIDATDPSIGVIPDTGADMSAQMTLALQLAAQNKAILDLPGGKIICSRVPAPHLGVTVRGKRSIYDYDNNGTRLVQKPGATGPILASEGYFSNVTWSNYGLDIDCVAFDGNKSQQTARHPLLVLRAGRSRIGAGVEINGSYGDGILVTPRSEGGVDITNSMPENEFACKILNCDGRALYGRDYDTNRASDISLLPGFVAGFCGAGTDTYGVEIERAAGLIVTGARFYNTGRGNALFSKVSLANIVGNHFEMTGSQGASGTVTDLLLEVNGFGAVAMSGNMHWSNHVPDSKVRRMIRIDGQNASARVSMAGHAFYSANQSIQAFDYVGNVGGRVVCSGAVNFNAPMPPASTQVRIIS